MNRFKCPACGRNQYTSKNEAEGCIFCIYMGPLELMEPAETEKAKQEIEEAFEEACIDDVEKVISYFEDAIRNNCKLMPECSKESRKGLCEQNWYFRAAIEALKKQVPRKRTGEKGYSECPLCDTCAIGDYCYKCGQKLNWEGEGLK